MNGLLPIRGQELNAFRACREENFARGGLFGNEHPEFGARAFNHVQGNDCNAVLHCVFLGIGAAVIATPVLGSLPAGIMVGAALGGMTGAIRHITKNASPRFTCNPN